MKLGNNVNKPKVCLPYRRVRQILVGHVVVDVLRPTWRLRPGAAKSRIQVDVRVQVQPQGGQVGPEGQGDEVGVGLRRPDERQQPNHAELVRDHRLGDVRDKA